MGFDLLPRELDKLQTVSLAGQLAQRRLARGLRLNPVEATALIAHVLHELIRDGNHSVAQLMAIGEPCARAGEGKGRGGPPRDCFPTTLHRSDSLSRTRRPRERKREVAIQSFECPHPYRPSEAPAISTKNPHPLIPP